MPISISTKKTAQHTETIVLPNTKIIKVLVDGVEEPNLQLTNNTGGNLNVEVTVRASS